MKPVSLFLSSVLVSAIGASNAMAASVTLGTSADAYVQVGNPGTNYGSDPAIQIKTDSSGTNNQFSRYGLMTFDLSSGDSLGALVDAQLRVAFTGTYAVTGSSFRVYGVNDLDAFETFTEGSVNYGNWGHGTNTDPFGFVTTGLTDLGTFSAGTGNAGTGITLSGASLVNFLNSDTNNVATFIIARVNNEATAFASFASKENTTVANRPSLMLSNVPEPTSAVLLLAGLSASSLRRRRA